MARNGQVLLRAAAVAVLIGSVLTLVNQADAVTGSGQIEWLPLVLVFITPFLVVSASQVFGTREARRSAGRIGYRRESFIGTLLSHGIPGRAIALSLAVGSTNTVIVAASALLAGRRRSSGRADRPGRDAAGDIRRALSDPGLPPDSLRHRILRAVGAANLG